MAKRDESVWPEVSAELQERRLWVMGCDGPKVREFELLARHVKLSSAFGSDDIPPRAA